MMEVFLMLVILGGILVAGPGLECFTKGVAGIFAYNVVETVIAREEIFLLTRVVCIDAAL